MESSPYTGIAHQTGALGAVLLLNVCFSPSGTSTLTRDLDGLTTVANAPPHFVALLRKNATSDSRLNSPDILPTKGLASSGISATVAAEETARYQAICAACSTAELQILSMAWKPIAVQR
jgi:hypothetical protein